MVWNPQCAFVRAVYHLALLIFTAQVHEASMGLRRCTAARECSWTIEAMRCQGSSIVSRLHLHTCHEKTTKDKIASPCIAICMTQPAQILIESQVQGLTLRQWNLSCSDTLSDSLTEISALTRYQEYQISKYQEIIFKLKNNFRVQSYFKVISKLFRNDPKLIPNWFQRSPQMIPNDPKLVVNWPQPQ